MAVGPVAAAVVVLVIALVLATSDGGSATEIALRGSGSARDATATAVVTKTGAGWRIALDASDLPKAQEGTYYEGSVEGPDGSVSIGTFTGGGPVELWSGVPVKDYPTMTITLEGVGSDPSPSGDVVLRGTVRDDP